MDVDPCAAVVREERPADETGVVEDADRIDPRVHTGQTEVGGQVLALPHRDIRRRASRTRWRARSTSSTSSNVSARTVRPSSCAGDRPSGTGYRRDRSRRRLGRLERAPHVVEVVPRHERDAVAQAMIDQLALRERHVGVDRPVSIRLPVADEPDGTVRLPVAEHRVHLARPAPDADLVAVHESHAPGPAVGAPHLLVREDGERAEAGRLEDRPDVEAEAVRDERERDAVRGQPVDEGRERGIQRTVLDGVRDELVTGRAEQRILRLDRVAQSDLAGIDGVVVLGPRRVAEHRQQELRDVARARRPVEVDEHRRDREHRGRLPARLRPWTTSGSGSRSGSRRPNGSAARTWRAPRCGRSTASCSRSRTFPIRP